MLRLGDASVTIWRQTYHQQTGRADFSFHVSGSEQKATAKVLNRREEYSSQAKSIASQVMKPANLQNALSTEREKARELERKVRELGLAASNAKSKARLAKSKAKAAKQEAKRARKLAKAAKCAFAEASSKAESAAAEVRALEGKLQKQLSKRNSGRTPAAKARVAAPRKSGARKAPTVPRSLSAGTGSLGGDAMRAVPTTMQAAQGIPATTEPLGTAPRSAGPKKPRGRVDGSPS